MPRKKPQPPADPLDVLGGIVAPIREVSRVGRRDVKQPAIGSTVKLASGGPPLTVLREDAGEFVCGYFDHDGAFWTLNFPATALRAHAE